VLVLVCGSALLIHRRGSLGLSNGITRLAVTTALTAASCLLTPYGIAPITHAADVRRTAVGLISEWSPVGFGNIAQLVGLIAVPTAVVLAVRVWRAGRPEVAAGIVVLAASTASAIRFLPMLAVFAAVEAALVIGLVNVRRKIFKIIVLVGTIGLAYLAVRNVRDVSTLGDAASPGLVKTLPSGCRLLNDDLVGDAVTLLRPDVPVSLDGRYDMYGRQIILTVLGLFDDRPGADAALARDRITCILGPTHAPLVERLSTDRDWQVLGRDGVRTLLVRSSGLPS
jgi:hypothetical protein